MYKVRFLGTSKEIIIKADNMKSAKWIFALQNNINSISRISASKIKEA